MITALWSEFLDWWQALPPLFAYLFSLPFVVALLGLLAYRLGSSGRGNDA